MAAASEFPSELSTHPLGLIALTGLDLTQKPLHKAIWESFSVNRRPERVPLSFKLVPIDHEYPKAKSKRTSYEWYIPKGILKTKWMNKHLEQVPALVVVFYELDWDNAQWKEKQTDCADQVEKVRASIHGRNTKVAVVLIQKNAPLPPGEDMQAAERAAALCSACDLSAKSLFVLPYTDHLFGYAIRLENAFYELAQSYYHGEARRVKSHKEFLNKTTHQLLLVRHQIKVAFFNELRQDPHAAVKHYRQAYTLMSEIKLTDINILEVKVVAGYISYKICRLSFQASAPLDAISQFRKHVDLWKEKVGCAELAFEHSAWLSKQFSLFGDLFDEAIRNGLTALQTQHPGFYYQQAANNAIVRRQLCEGLCHHGPSSPISTEPLELAGKLDFYGQRPWRQGYQGAEPLDQPLEQNGILALQAQELSVDHSWIIIPLLSSAVAQFKKYKSPRMKRYLMVQMGEEYYHARDYSKALMLLGRVTWDYRHERWWSLLTSVLITSLRCAYLVGNVQEYVTISMDLMGKYGLNSPEEKTRVQMNLIHVISNECPEPEPGCDVDAVEEAKEIWKTLTKQTGQVFTVQMDQIAPFVECKAEFGSPSLHADSAIILHIHLRVTCPFPIRFSKLSVFFSNQAYNQYCCIDNGEGADSEGGLYLLPAKTKVIPFKFFPQPEDVGKQLQVSSIALELGSQQSRCAVLVWNGGGTEGTTTINCFAKHGNSHPDIEDQLDWEALQIASNILINPREPKMEIDVLHDSPTLVNEFFKVTLKARSLEDTNIQDIRVWFGFQEEHDPSIVDTSTVCREPPKTGQEAPVQSFVFFNRNSMEKEMEQTYYVRCAQVGSRSLLAKITYSVTLPAANDSTPITCLCIKEKKMSVKTVMPFDISLSLTSLRLERLDQLSEEEPFLLLASIKCSSPWPVTMVTTRLNLSSEVDFVGEKMDSQLEGVSLQQGESASECYCLAAREDSSLHKVINIGSLVLEWRRASSPSDCPAVITELTFPSVTVESVPFFISTELPSYGCVQTLMPLSYVIHNRTLQVQEVEVTIEPSESFMFSGQKQVQFRLLPESDHKLSYNLYPLVPGHVTLPKLHLNLPRFQTNWDEHAQKMIPTQVFIKPRAKPLVQAQ